MTQTFKCPSCGAPLEVDQDPDPTVVCRHCGQTVIVPETLRKPGAAVYEVHVQPPRTPRWVWTLIGLAVGGSLLVGLIGAIASPLIGLFAVRESIQTISTVAPMPTIDMGFLEQVAPQAQPSPTPGFARVALQFGSEGIGPGRFEDARSIAVDGEGHIYVGEYQGGRIQVFDAEGQFITQWTADAEFPLRGMAAGRDGTVYIVQRGSLAKYSGATGERLGEIAFDDETSIDDAAVRPAGGLVVFSGLWSDDLLVLDGQEAVQNRITGAVSGQTGDPTGSLRVAVSGDERIFALAGTGTDEVFVYSLDGQFITRFGGTGDQPGQLRAPSALAVDGRGRVYVADFKGIQVFEAGGRYLGLIEMDGVPSGLVFNDQDEMFVVARTQVYKFVIEDFPH